MEVKLQGQYSHTANMLLRQLKTKEITLDEFLMQCAYWGVKTIDDIYFRSLPHRSMAVIEYENLPYSKKSRLTQQYYEDSPEVLRYLEQRDRILRINKTNLWRLKQYKEHIPESDVKNHEKLDKAILDFKMKMEE